jgi:threonine synthase
MNVKYESTRDNNLKINSSQAVLKGLSDDGGLFFPKDFKNIKINIKHIEDLNYKELAVEIFTKFFSDYTKEEILYSVENAYGNKFDTEEIVPLKNEGNYNFLELFHGRTLAFKDVALSILPYFMKAAKDKNKIKNEILILTATSGDTGKAALEGFKDIEGISISVFYPEGGVSKVQELQMKTQEGNNTHVLAVEGNFDDAQTAVKNIFNNKNVKDKLLDDNIILSSANSINVGRLIPQIVYYFYSYNSLLKNKKIKSGEKINFVVPTGNFGNILAGYMAKEMGLPVNKLICASNENNVLTDFINTGTYDINREFIKTISPSMDILISSNLERLIYMLSGGDDNYIKKIIAELDEKGKYKIDSKILDKIQDSFWSSFSTQDEILNKIKKVYREYNYIIDPHTAVAVDVYDKYKHETGDKSVSIILSTASPFKFIESIYDALDIEKTKEGKELIMEFSEEFNIPIPKSLEEILNKPFIHNKTIKINDVKNEILKIAHKEEKNV